MNQKSVTRYSHAIIINITVIIVGLQPNCTDTFHSYMGGFAQLYKMIRREFSTIIYFQIHTHGLVLQRKFKLIVINIRFFYKFLNAIIQITK